MHLRYIKRTGFKSSFAMFSVKYGSSDFNFSLDGKVFNTKPGIAHFIEHKCFAMPDGSDAFYKFSSLGASANAYTTYDRTIYYFKTVSDLYEPLGLLIDMMLSKGFTKENIEREKNQLFVMKLICIPQTLTIKMETLTIKKICFFRNWIFI
ncbi:MAG: insulinase family protein [Clostridium sp.]|nr:MAG: insulinase family protein [Clostridium sp.]